MIHELRIYHCLPNRLPALLERFENVTLKLWDGYGIRQAGFWTTLVGPSNSALYYPLAWQSLAEREDKWSRFIVDPDWVAARLASEVDGPIVARVENMFLAPTTFSAVT